MIIRLTFKTPDAVDDAIADLDEDSKDIAKNVISKWVEYGEYIRVDVDTEKQTCTVLPA